MIYSEGFYPQRKENGDYMNEIKNVLIVSDYAFFEGGAANVAVQTVLALANCTNLNIYFFAGSGTPCEQLSDSRAKVIALNLPDLLGNRNKISAIINGIYNKKVEKEFKKVLSTLDREETIVHIHTWTKVLSSSVFKVCKEMEFRTFLTIHDYFLACPNGACYNYVNHKICELQPLSNACLKSNCDARNYMQKIWRCIRQVKQNQVIRHFENLNYIFISSYQEKQLLQRLPDIKNKFLVKNPIYVDQRYHIESEKNSNYIYIGRLSREKGPQLFCEAVTQAKVKGVIIGAGNLETELKKRYPDIEFAGWQNKDQIRDKLKMARALIFPSLWYEGSPLTTLEVQAYGIPCIVTDCSSAKDDIVQGENGEIVNAEISDIVSAINRFKDDKYVKRLSQNTYQMFDENRASEKWYVKNLLNTYLERKEII